MSLVVSKGKQSKPARVVIYGCEGIGKSTLAAQFPKPLILDIENGTGLIEVDRINTIATLADFTSTLKALSADSMGYETLVVDTADALEKLVTRAVCEKKGVSGIEDIGYGKGWIYVEELWRTILDQLDVLQSRTGMHIVLIAHAWMRKFEQPDEQGAYDRWELKLSKKSAPLLKEWPDALLFLNYRTLVTTDQTGKAKAAGNRRVMYTSHHACWDAKNRYGLPNELDMKYEAIAIIFNQAKTPPKDAKADQAKPRELPPVSKPDVEIEKAPDGTVASVNGIDVSAFKGTVASISNDPEVDVSDGRIERVERLKTFCKERGYSPASLLAAVPEEMRAGATRPSLLSDTTIEWIFANL